MRRIDRLRGGRPEERALQDLASWVPFAGLNPMGMNPVHTTWGKLTTEPIPNNFEGYVRNIYKRDGVVFGLIAARAALFKQARFQWQRMENGTPGDLFGTADLALLERPWPNGTTSDLLARMEQDASLAGQFYGVRRETPSGPRIRRLRPSLVYVVTSSPSDLPDDPDAEPFAYLYWPNGQPGQGEPLVFAPSEVIHYAPTPDPEANWRGMSWLTPVLREIESDMGATEHKARFFENAATPNLAVSLDKALAKKDALEFIEAMRDNEGARNAYKTLWLAGGADVKVVGADLKQLDFKVTQGAGETRLASAAQVPPIIAGLSEGLGAATYSNYGQARRHFADIFARPAWGDAAAALESVISPRSGARLWYDDQHISFLQEDQRDEAEIFAADANTIRTLTDGGFDPESVKRAVKSRNFSLLKHTGLLSVQMQPPGTTAGV